MQSQVTEFSELGGTRAAFGATTDASQFPEPAIVPHQSRPAFPERSMTQFPKRQRLLLPLSADGCTADRGSNKSLERTPAESAFFHSRMSGGRRSALR